MILMLSSLTSQDIDTRPGRNPGREMKRRPRQ